MQRLERRDAITQCRDLADHVHSLSRLCLEGDVDDTLLGVSAFPL